MRLLFVKEQMSWPRSSGHDVHSYYSMQALVKQGHVVGLVTLREINPQAIDGCGLSNTWCLSKESLSVESPLLLNASQEKFRNYWGIEKKNIVRIGEIAKEFQADAVVVVGLNVLPYLGAVDQALRIWYAGDEWVWHHLSQVKWLRPSTWGELKQALVKGLYERAYAPLLDRVWMVSQADEKAIHRIAKINAVDVLPNGVDTEHFKPMDVPQKPRSCTFWGRLDFGPNIQALEWFCQKIWPVVRQAVNDANFTIYGFMPTDPVKKLVKAAQGIELKADLPDLREEIARHELVVLPFISGGGIKNKLLEAGAMGKAIICTPRTTEGLSTGSSVRIASTPQEWLRAMQSLWKSPVERNQLGQEARCWVMQEHTWDAVASKAVQGIEESIRMRKSA